MTYQPDLPLCSQPALLIASQEWYVTFSWRALRLARAGHSWFCLPVQMLAGTSSSREARPTPSPLPPNRAARPRSPSPSASRRSPRPAAASAPPPQRCGAPPARPAPACRVTAARCPPAHSCTAARLAVAERLSMHAAPQALSRTPPQERNH